jgi:hypothetical protein
MEKKSEFTLVEIMPQERFSATDTEQRLAENNRMANRLLALEDFMNKVIRG